MPCIRVSVHVVQCVQQLHYHHETGFFLCFPNIGRIYSDSVGEEGAIEVEVLDLVWKSTIPVHPDGGVQVDHSWTDR